MNLYIKNSTFKHLHRILCVWVALMFFTNIVFCASLGYAQTVLNLPAAGTMLVSNGVYAPMVIKGINIDLENGLNFDFIMNEGDTHFSDQEFAQEAQKLIKYFLASLTIPQEEMWVNLSPYEKDRIIMKNFGQTEMGRDLLVQDYMLKQLTSSLMYPEDDLGAEFWSRVYKKVAQQFGPEAQVPLNTFSKIWIVPETAKIYEHDRGAVVVESHLKVMLEEDYLALEANQGRSNHGLGDVGAADLHSIKDVSLPIVRDILIPEIEREVNQGEIFANLRQIHTAMLLAKWYKEHLQTSLLGQVYVDQGKTKGVNSQDPKINQKIYNQYVEAFKVGVFDFIKEDYDESTQQVVPRKYFSGGFAGDQAQLVTVPILNSQDNRKNRRVTAEMAALGDSAQLADILPVDGFSVVYNLQIDGNPLTVVVKGKTIFVPAKHPLLMYRVLSKKIEPELYEQVSSAIAEKERKNQFSKIIATIESQSDQTMRTDLADFESQRLNAINQFFIEHSTIFREPSYKEHEHDFYWIQLMPLSYFDGGDILGMIYYTETKGDGLVGRKFMVLSFSIEDLSVDPEKLSQTIYEQYSRVISQTPDSEIISSWSSDELKGAIENADQQGAVDLARKDQAMTVRGNQAITTLVGKDLLDLAGISQNVSDVLADDVILSAKRDMLVDLMSETINIDSQHLKAMVTADIDKNLKYYIKRLQADTYDVKVATLEAVDAQNRDDLKQHLKETIKNMEDSLIYYLETNFIPLAKYFMAQNIQSAEIIQQHLNDTLAVAYEKVNQLKEDYQALMEHVITGGLNNGNETGDKAMMGDNQELVNGGIDFNPEMSQMTIEKQGQGFQMPQIPLTGVEAYMNVEGFVPIIINVAPPQSLPMILGLSEDEDGNLVAQL